MNLILALLVLVGAAAIVRWVRLPTHLGEAVRGAKGTYSVVSNPSLTDDEKEARLRKEAVRLFGLFGRIVLGSLLALGVPLGAVWALDRLGMISLSDVVHILLSLEFLVGAGVLGGLAVWGARRWG